MADLALADAVQLGRDLRVALRADGLTLAYQPEYDLVSGHVVATEALARWVHSDRGEICPEVFVAAAEQAGLIDDLGDWVLTAALADFATWSAELPALDIALRVNVSITQLERATYVSELRAALSRYRVDPRRLCLEITETVPRESPEAVVESVIAARALGLQVAVDDLGSGYSTLGMLRAFPVDVIKLDRTLVTGVADDPKAAAIVEAMVALADRLDLTLVVEGIETREDRETLTALGCRNGQGFHLSTPLPASDVVPYLAEHGRRRPRPRF